MSLFSSFILPYLEKELIYLEPEVAEFLLNQLKVAATEIVDWAELNLKSDLNGDGKIGKS